MPRAATGPSELLPGTLDMLILQTLTVQPMHGYAIAQHIRRLTDGVLTVEQGSLYPALERLLNTGMATAKWSLSPTRRRARYYPLTREGRARLKEKAKEYDKVVRAIALI